MIRQSLRIYRDAYRGLSPSIWLLSGVMLINRSGTMVLPYLTLYLTQHLHYSVKEAGIVMAVYGTGALAGTFLGGWLSDRIGFYYVQFLSLLISGFFLILLQFIDGFYTMCGTVFIYTLLGDAFRPANSSAIAHYSLPENRTRAYSLNRLAINLGWSFGGGIGGYLAGIDYKLLFWADGLTCVFAALVLRFFLPPSAETTRSVKLSQDEGAAVTTSPYRDRLFLLFLVSTVLFAIVFMQLFSMATLYYKQVLHLDETQIGLLMTLNGLLIVAVEMALVYSIEKRYGTQKIKVIPYGILLVGLSFWLLNGGQWPGLVLVSVLLVTVGEMLAMPFMQTFAVERASAQNRGQYLALYSMAYAVAQITAPVYGSQVVERYGFATLWTLCLGLCVLSASVCWWLVRHLRLSRNE
ncbi:MFS transporter [Tellurirhabdus bombi]|uniref:MFS transporter n=1 Tax=Tellurirhabdus bombi TaxID=2907205 RepID=UPI001F158A91|nr:MFS transporter [Tellurirhabdus bombi]